MHETKRYDGKGNLIEIISAEKCQITFWQNFGGGPIGIPANEIDINNSNSGQFQLMTRLKNTLPKQACAHCKEMFQPPIHSKKAKYCLKPGVADTMQCRRLAYRLRLLKPKRKVVCGVCSVTFETSKTNARFCRKPDCNRNTLSVRENALGRAVNCHHCGAEFMACHTGNQKYCVMPYFSKSLQCVTLATQARKHYNLSQ